MDKDNKKYITVNVDGVDYELEVNDKTFTDKTYYKTTIGKMEYILFGDDPEESLRASFESEKRLEEFRKYASEKLKKYESEIK